MSFNLIELLRICVLICRNLPCPQKVLATRLSCSTISNAIYSFCNSTGLFSKQDFAGSPKHIKKHFESFNRDDYVRQAAAQMGHTKLWAKLSEGDMIARETYYHEHVWQNSGTNFINFPMIKKIMLKRFRKILKLLRVSVILGECYLLNIFSVMKLHLS